MTTKTTPVDANVLNTASNLTNIVEQLPLNDCVDFNTWTQTAITNTYTAPGTAAGTWTIPITTTAPLSTTAWQWPPLDPYKLQEDLNKVKDFLKTIINDLTEELQVKYVLLMPELFVYINNPTDRVKAVILMKDL